MPGGVKLKAAVEAMRPHQWIKNGFVLAAPVFGGRMTDAEWVLLALAAFAAFCATSSAVYVWNDLVDVKRDRAHPLKRSRPFASGRLTLGEGVALLAGLVVLIVALSAWLLPEVAWLVLLAYVAANVLYSLVLKHVVILDVMFIAVGFILRILMGAATTEVEPSYWLILCTLTLSLFLGFTKRRAELVALRNDAQVHREVLEHYSLAFVDQMVAIVTGTTLVCYILYTVDAHTREIFGTRGLVATVPFVLYGMFRYLYLAYHRNEGGNPSKTIAKDLPFVINLVLWGLVCVLVVYAGGRIHTYLPW